jgi:hypothetical protein
MFEIVGYVTNTTGGSNTFVVAIVAGCAAILASIVTGGILTRNNQSTIGAERDRLTQTLEAEERRLDKRLSFERAERDRSALIEVLESIAKNLEGLSHAAMESIDAANTINAAFRLNEGVDWEPVQDLSDRRGHLEKSAMDSLLRLSLMLGDESDALIAQVLKSTNASGKESKRPSVIPSSSFRQSGRHLLKWRPPVRSFLSLPGPSRQSGCMNQWPRYRPIQLPTSRVRLLTDRAGNRAARGARSPFLTERRKATQGWAGDANKAPQSVSRCTGCSGLDSPAARTNAWSP